MRAFLFVLAFVACERTADPTPESPPEKTDEERVCEWFRAHGCEMGEPTPEGATCEAVLANAAENDIDLTGDVRCVLSAPDCATADRCP